MPRNRAMAGPGSKKMGGIGIKAGRPPTPMAGSGLGAPKGGAAMAMGAPPMAPKVANVRPPGIGAGGPPPMPGGAAGPPPGPPPPAAGGMGGSGGFAKGGSAVDTAVKHQPPSPPPDGPTFSKSQPPSPPDDGPTFSKSQPASSAYRKGGSVGIGGGDTKSRHKGTVHKGR